jgi:hypothetical protein
MNVQQQHGLQFTIYLLLMAGILLHSLLTIQI